MCNARHCRRLVMKPSFCETHAATVIARSDSDEAIFLYAPSFLAPDTRRFIQIGEDKIVVLCLRPIPNAHSYGTPSAVALYAEKSQIFPRLAQIAPTVAICRLSAVAPYMWNPSPR